MHSLLTEALPLMQKLSNDLDQSCQLTVNNSRLQVVSSKADEPCGVGFSVRVGAALDVLASASGRALLAFQDPETRELRIAESLFSRPDHADPPIRAMLDMVKMQAFESIPSAQVRSLFAVRYPIRDPRGVAIAALTFPCA
jgi:DNA-binding IclR family transcriptional regulator